MKKDKEFSTIAKLLFVFGLIFLNACSKPETTKEKIQIDNKKITQFASIDPLVDTAYIIALETNEQSLIPDWPDQVLITKDDKIIITNTGMEHILSIFDVRTGKFIYQLKSEGEGPGEFSSFRIATYNPFENNIEVFADFQRKEIAYSTNGQFLKEKPQYLLYSTKTYISSDVCAYSCNQSNYDFFGTEESYQLAIHNQRTNTWLKTHPIPKSFAEKSTLYNPYSFNESSGQVLWNKPFSNQIYNISKENITLRNEIQFKQKFTDIEVIKSNSQYSSLANMFEDMGIPFLPSFSIETTKTIFFPYNNEKHLLLCALDKQKNRVMFNTQFLVFEAWDITLPYPLNASQDTLVIPLASSLFKQLIQNHPNPSLLPKAFHDIHKTLKATDNPVLMIIKLK